MEQTYLRLIHSRETFDPKVQRGIDNIVRCIIDLVVRNRGEVSLQKIESVTGLKKIGATITADIIRFMVREGVIELRGNTIRGSVAKLTEIIEQERTHLPAKHGKPWSEDEYVRLCEMRLEKVDPAIIAKKLGRTESSVAMQTALLRKAFRLIPIIERHKAVREFVSDPASPNPES